MKRFFKKVTVLVCLLCVALSFACFAACETGTPSVNPSNPTQQGQSGNNGGSENGGNENASGSQGGEDNGASQKPALTGTDISTLVFKVDGTKLSVTVSNATETYSLKDKITVADGASWKVYSDIGCTKEVVSKTVALNEGDNVVYAFVTNGSDERLYTVTIHRASIFTVTFNTNGGTEVESRNVDENSLITAPETSRKGYYLVSWDYDFNEPVTKNITVTANWSPDVELSDDGKIITGLSNKNISNLVILSK